jgi:hypothetical protein
MARNVVTKAELQAAIAPLATMAERAPVSYSLQP